MYKVQRKKPVRTDFDLIVLGTGSGGGVAAHIAVKAGKRVAVFEPDTIGGECPNYGCVPTKALLQAAESYKVATDSAHFGIQAKSVTFDYKAIKAWKDRVVGRTGTSEGEAVYLEEGIKLIRSKAHFIDPWTVSAGGKRYTARKFLIATGTRQAVPPIPGLSETGFITYREAIDLTKPPKSLFVIGGGAIGCEFTELFSTFGTKVHIGDIAPRLIPLEDPEAGELLQAVFESRGIKVHTGVRISRIVKDGAHKVVYYEKNGVVNEATVEEVLLSTGMAPNTDIGLENADVDYSRTGIDVNRYMQTTNKHIYAAGDVVGPYRFTHTAAYQSRIAAHNMFHTKWKYAARYNAVPRCTFVDPEIASVGLSEQQLKDAGILYQTAAVPISIIGRSNTSDLDTGFVKVIADKRGVLLGATIASPRAGEMIHELTLAINRRLKAKSVAETIHAFPTWSEAVRIACQKIK